MTSAPGGSMLAEIHEEARLVARWADAGGYPVDAAVSAARELDAETVVLVARGTSDNAADFGRLLLEVLGGFTVASASPSSFTMYGTRPRPGRRLCIAVSQSGQSPDLVACTRALREAGALTIVLTNDPGSPLAAEGVHVIDLGAGPERAVAATKTFLCELLALHDIAVGLSGASATSRAFLATAIGSTLASPVDQVAEALHPALMRTGHLVALGRGATTPIAREGALKIMETTGVPALGYSAADFEHGPLAILRPGTPVVVVSAPGSAGRSLATLAGRLAEAGAVVVGVGPEELPGSAAWIRVPDCGHLLTPLTAVVPLQLLAHRLALLCGRDPDQPRGLSKVTLTR